MPRGCDELCDSKQTRQNRDDVCRFEEARLCHDAISPKNPFRLARQGPKVFTEPAPGCHSWPPRCIPLWGNRKLIVKLGSIRIFQGRNQLAAAHGALLKVPRVDTSDEQRAFPGLDRFNGADCPGGSLPHDLRAQRTCSLTEPIKQSCDRTCLAHWPRVSTRCG